MKLLAIFLAIGGPAVSAIFPYLPDQQYRFCFDTDPECARQTAGGGKPNQPKPNGPRLDAVEVHEGYKIVYIEYKDNGRPWDEIQIESARQLIRLERQIAADAGLKGGPIHLIFFVHGWANNANKYAPKRRDVERFNDYLRDYAVRFKHSMPVVGVYLAWHGRSIDLPGPLHIPSFWTRSAAARRVGSRQLGQDFRELVHLGRIGDGGAGSNWRERSRIIAFGHSFGARVLETALIGGIPSEGPFAETCRGLMASTSQIPPVDLVVFENAATGARFVWRQFVSCQPCGERGEGCVDCPPSKPNFLESVMARSRAFRDDTCKQNPWLGCQPYPLLISISGKRDLLTRVLLTLASGQHPAAFLPMLQTHDVKEMGPNDTVDPKLNHVFSFEVPKLDEKGNIIERKFWRVQRKGGRNITPTNAIWTMAVPRQIISDHGDVWNPGLINFQLDLITSRDESVAAAQRAAEQ